MVTRTIGHLSMTCWSLSLSTELITSLSLVCRMRGNNSELVGMVWLMVARD